MKILLIVVLTAIVATAVSLSFNKFAASTSCDERRNSAVAEVDDATQEGEKLKPIIHEIFVNPNTNIDIRDIARRIEKHIAKFRAIKSKLQNMKDCHWEDYVDKNIRNVDGVIAAETKVLTLVQETAATKTNAQTTATETSVSKKVDCATEPKLMSAFIKHSAEASEGLYSILTSRPGSASVSLASIDKHIEELKSLQRELIPIVRACEPPISRLEEFFDQNITMLVDGVAEARQKGAR